MPLQKPPPHGPQHLDGYNRPRPLQERRRTLQTISELSVTDNVPPHFGIPIQPPHNGRLSDFTTPTTERKPRNPSKRRSLPQYCSSTACLRAQALNASAPAHPSSSSPRTPPKQPGFVASNNVVQSGWNDRRERARMQREQAIGGPTHLEQYATQDGWIGSDTFMSKQTPLPFTHTTQHYPKSYTSHPHPLRSSRSANGYFQTVQRRASFGGTSGYHDLDMESAGHVSTDSSSQRSLRDTACRRSHSSPCQGSVAVPVAITPVPRAIVPRRQRYYANPANFRHGLVAGQLGPVQNLRPSSTPRSSSMPSMRGDSGVGMVHQKGRRSSAPRSPSHSATEKEHDLSIQKARLATLAALTASPSPPSSSSSSNHDPCTSQRCNRITSPLPTARPHSTRRSMSTSPPNPFPQPRAIPTRESLTQWKAERDGAKIEFGSLRRAEMKERVRRANEAEIEREKELLSVGKGVRRSVSTEVDGERERKKDMETGCFGGVLRVFGFGWGM